MDAAPVEHTHPYGRAWLVILRGIAAFLFGIITFVAPGISAAALVLVFGVYALADGVLLIVGALRPRQPARPRWMLFTGGIIGVMAGLVAFFFPGVTVIGLLALVAAWALVTGVLQVVAAINLRKVITGEWLLVISGVLSIAFGTVLVMFPAAGALALVLWIGAYAVVYGVVLFALGVRLRRWERGSDDTPPAPIEVGGRPSPAPQGAHAA